MHFIIRKIAYHFSDEYLFSNNEGSIAGEYTDFDTAYAAWRALEIAAVRNTYLDQIEPLTPILKEGEPYRLNVNQYLKENLNIEFLVHNPQWPSGHAVKDGFMLPKTATDDQVWHIRELSGLKFYTLSAFEGTPSFFVIEKKAPFFEDAGIITWGGAPIFFNTYEDAVNNIGNHIADFVLEGTPEELSDMPDILRQIIRSNEMFEVDKNKQEIRVWVMDRDAVTNAKLKELFAVLKVPPFVIRSISIDEVRGIDHDVYEEM